MEIHRHANFDSVHLVTLSLDTGSAFIVFIENGGNLIPIEIRISPLPADEFIVRDYQELSKMEVPKDFPDRLSTNLIREISLSEVIARIRAQQHVVRHDPFPTRSDIESTLLEANLLQQINQDRVIFRNTRDFEAALSRVEASQVYVNELDKGSTQPLNQVAKGMGISIGRARALIAGARKDGYLTSTHPGTAGGNLTSKVDEFWALVMGEK